MYIVLFKINVAKYLPVFNQRTRYFLTRLFSRRVSCKHITLELKLFKLNTFISFLVHVFQSCAHQQIPVHTNLSAEIQVHNSAQIFTNHFTETLSKITNNIVYKYSSTSKSPAQKPT